MTPFERQEYFALRMDERRRTDRFAVPDTGKYAQCPHCERATQLIEHAASAQLTLDPERQRDDLYFTCLWCNGEIAESKQHVARKPVTTGLGEDDLEWLRRTA